MVILQHPVHPEVVETAGGLDRAVRTRRLRRLVLRIPVRILAVILLILDLYLVLHHHLTRVPHRRRPEADEDRGLRGEAVVTLVLDLRFTVCGDLVLLPRRGVRGEEELVVFLNRHPALHLLRKYR